MRVKYSNKNYELYQATTKCVVALLTADEDSDDDGRGEERGGGHPAEEALVGGLVRASVVLRHVQLFTPERTTVCITLVRCRGGLA